MIQGKNGDLSTTAKVKMFGYWGSPENGCLITEGDSEWPDQPRDIYWPRLSPWGMKVTQKEIKSTEQHNSIK